MTLPEYIAAHLEKKFDWGANDCILFAVGWLEHSSGVDYLGAYKPWNSAKQAMRKVESLGGLDDLFDSRLDRIEPNFATDGDICIIDGTASLFTGAYVVSVGENGLVFKDRTEALSAWRCKPK